MVAYVVDEQMVQIVHGPTVHKQIAQNWGLVSIETPIPICDVLRGDQPSVEICNQSEFTPWVAATAGAAIANLSSMIVHPIGDPNQPDAVIAITWPTPHELDVLERELLELLLLRCAPALKRSERGDSHGDIAMKLQNWLLNTPFPDVDGVNVAALYEPGRDVHAVGGDWHDVVRISDTRTALVIGDVCGHDIEAAVAMSQVRHVLSTNLHVLADPVAALSMTDEYLRQRTPPPDGDRTHHHPRARRGRDRGLSRPSPAHRMPARERRPTARMWTRTTVGQRIRPLHEPFDADRTRDCGHLLHRRRGRNASRVDR